MAFIGRYAIWRATCYTYIKKITTGANEKKTEPKFVLVGFINSEI